jgi:sulfur carrier protein ThiS
MQITVVTSGILGKYLPAGAKGNKAELDVAEGARPVDVMGVLGLPLDDGYLTILNGDLLPIAEREVRALAAGDELGIFPPLKGG